MKLLENWEGDQCPPVGSYGTVRYVSKGVARLVVEWDAPYELGHDGLSLLTTTLQSAVRKSSIWYVPEDHVQAITETEPFAVGDRVRVITLPEDKPEELLVGMTGTILTVIADDGLYNVGVEFDSDVGGHALQDGEARSGHGWYMTVDSLEKISEVKEEMAVTAKSVKGLQALDRYDGQKIVLPTTMTVPSAIKQLQELEAWQSQVTERVRIYRGWNVKDVTVAVNVAIERTFGHVVGKENASMFGTTPPRMERVQISKDKWRDCVVFNASLPTWKGIISIPYGDGVQDCSVSLKTANLWLEKSDAMLDLVDTILETESIYKGRAIDADFTFINLAAQRAPTFDRVTERTVQATVYAPIKAALRMSGKNTKRGVLLVGPYGTGKTLTAAYAAQLAEEADVTFMYIASSQTANLADIMKSATRYAPVVMFFEDVDTVAGGERDDSMNELLNLLDGIDTKGASVMFVFSTNHIERIHPAFLRPGRMDAVIHMTYPDEQTRATILSAYSGLPIDNCRRAAQLAIDGHGDGFSGAELKEAAERARWFLAVDGNETLTEENLTDAVEGLRGQVQLARAEHLVAKPVLDLALRDLVYDALREVVSCATEGMVGASSLRGLKADTRPNTYRA